MPELTVGQTSGWRKRGTQPRGTVALVPDKADRKRAKSRSEALTADELEAGTEDPLAQATEILAESDARAADRVAPPGELVEHGQSEDNVTED